MDEYLDIMDSTISDKKYNNLNSIPINSGIKVDKILKYNNQSGNTRYILLSNKKYYKLPNILNIKNYIITLYRNILIYDFITEKTYLPRFIIFDRQLIDIKYKIHTLKLIINKV